MDANQPAKTKKENRGCGISVLRHLPRSCPLLRSDAGLRAPSTPTVGSSRKDRAGHPASISDRLGFTALYPQEDSRCN